MNFFSPLIDVHFWFDLTPIRMASAFEGMFFGLFALFVIAGAVIRMMVRNRSYEKYRAEMFKRVAGILTTTGVVGLIWFFFTFEEIQFFGARFWFLVIIAGVVVSLVQLKRFMKREVPALQHREQSRSEVNKYLPRRSR
jgi:regulator of protease activity HflC (stomatin/prohibitin superfamily)